MMNRILGTFSIIRGHNVHLKVGLIFNFRLIDQKVPVIPC